MPGQGRARGAGTAYACHMREVAVYSVLRVGLFLLAFGGFYLAGAGMLLAALLAAIVSFALAFVLLRRQRDDVTRVIVRRRAARVDAGGRRRLRDLVAEDTRAEDMEADHLDSGQVGSEHLGGRDSVTGPRPGDAGSRKPRSTS